MPWPADSRRKIRFADYEIDMRTAEVRQNGHKFVLQGQPFQVLAVLLERPGELVTLEELKKRLWSADTFVDFDHSLNKAVNRFGRRFPTRRRSHAISKPYPAVATGSLGKLRRTRFHGSHLSPLLIQTEGRSNLFRRFPIPATQGSDRRESGNSLQQ